MITIVQLTIMKIIRVIHVIATMHMLSVIIAIGSHMPSGPPARCQGS